MKKALIFVTVSIIIIAFVGCKNYRPLSTLPAARPSAGSEILYKYRWVIEEISGQPVSILSGKTPELLFTPGQLNKVSGTTGCNQLNGSFQLTGSNDIKFSPLAITKMACVADNVESKFLAAMGKVNNWRIVFDQLFLSDGASVLMKFRSASNEGVTLDGTWELNYISGPRIAFGGLYPDKKPTIKFNLTTNELGGTTSCNGFSSKIMISKNKISIADPFAKTMIFCEGGGETTFLNMMKKVNRYAVTQGNTLTFLIDDVAVMRFAKK